MTDEKLKTAIANINAYLSECPTDDDTVTLTVNVIRSVKENYEELIGARAEIERLEDLNKCYYSSCQQISKSNHEIKAEAVKEFAERLKADIVETGDEHGLGNRYPVLTYSYIDNLVKEMVGEG